MFSQRKPRGRAAPGGLAQSEIMLSTEAMKLRELRNREILANRFPQENQQKASREETGLPGLRRI